MSYIEDKVLEPYGVEIGRFQNANLGWSFNGFIEQSFAFFVHEMGMPRDSYFYFKRGLLSISCRHKSGHAEYQQLEKDSDLKKLIDDFEEEHNAQVFMVLEDDRVPGVNIFMAAAYDEYFPQHTANYSIYQGQFFHNVYYKHKDSWYCRRVAIELVDGTVCIK